MIHVYQSSNQYDVYTELIRKFNLFDPLSVTPILVFPSNRWKDDFTDYLIHKIDSHSLILDNFHSYNSFLQSVYQKAQIYHESLSQKVLLSDKLKIKLLDSLVRENAEQLTFFTNSLDKKARTSFIKRIDQSIKSLMIQGYSPKSFQKKIEYDEELLNSKITDLSLIFTKAMELIYSNFYDELSIQYDLVKYLNEDIIANLNNDSGSIVFVGFDSFNPLFLTVMEKLNVLSLEIQIYLPGQLSDSALIHTNNHFKSFKKQQNLYFHEFKKLHAKNSSNFFFDNFQNLDDEIDAIIQKIISLNVDHNIPLYDIALTMPNIDLNQNIVRSNFAKYGIPINMTASLALKDNQAIIHCNVLINLILHDFKFTDILKFIDFALGFENFNKERFYSLCNVNKCYKGFDDICQILEKDMPLLNDLKNLEYLQAIQLHTKYQTLKLDEIIKELFESLNYEKIIETISETDIPLAQSYSRAVYKLYEIHDSLMASFTNLNKFEMSISEYFAYLLEEINDATFQIPEKKNVGVQILPFLEARSTKIDYLFVASLNQSQFPRLKKKNTFFTESEEIKFDLDDDNDSIYEDLYLFQQLKVKPTNESYFSSHTKDSENDSCSFIISDYSELYKSWRVIDKIFENKNELIFEASKETKQSNEIGKQEIQKVFSASRLQMYQDCSYKYFIHYVNGLRKNVEKDIDLENLDLGNIVHKVLYDFHTGLSKQSDKKVNQKELIKACLSKQMEELKSKSKSNYDDLYVDLIAINSEPGLFDDYLSYSSSNDFKDFVPSYFEWRFGEKEEQDNSKHMIQSNVTIETDKGPIKFKGSIDRIDILEDEKKYLLIDYKFKNKKDAKERNEMHKDMYLQIPLYLIILDKIFNKEYQLEEALLIHLKSGEQMDDVMSLFNRKTIDYPELLDRYNSIINALINELYDSKFLLNPNPNKTEICKYCDYMNVCRIKEKTF